MAGKRAAIMMSLAHVRSVLTLTAALATAIAEDPLHAKVAALEATVAALSRQVQLHEERFSGHEERFSAYSELHGSLHTRLNAVELVPVPDGGRMLQTYSNSQHGDVAQVVTAADEPALPQYEFDVFLSHNLPTYHIHIR